MMCQIYETIMKVWSKEDYSLYYLHDVYDPPKSNNNPDISLTAHTSDNLDGSV